MMDVVGIGTWTASDYAMYQTVIGSVPTVCHHSILSYDVPCKSSSINLDRILFGGL